jgi:mannose-6-phosphate isomerase-like protein (cupin superfamily)
VDKDDGGPLAKAFATSAMRAWIGEERAMRFFRIEELPEAEMLPGITRRAVWLNGVMLTFFTFADDAEVPEHTHPHEQITVVSRGTLEFTLAGESRRIKKGEGVCIPANVPHSARVVKGPVEAYDAWYPPREEYRHQEE